MNTRRMPLPREGNLPRRLLRRLDEECPYQVVLPRQHLTDDSEILDFLLAHVGWFDMYVEDDYAAFVRYCFEEHALPSRSQAMINDGEARTKWISSVLPDPL